MSDTQNDNFALSIKDFLEISRKYGPLVLQLVLTGLTKGFSLSYLKEILAILGPTILENVVDGKAKFALPGNTCVPLCDACPCRVIEPFKLGSPIIQGEQKDVLTDVAVNGGILNNSLISKVFVNLLLQILQTNGEQFAKMIVEWVVKFLQDAANQERLSKAFSEALADANK